MFKDPLATKKAKENPVTPFGKQPTYESKKQMFAGGDYYGTGFKAKIGKLRSDLPGATNIPQKAMRKPPDSLA